MSADTWDEAASGWDERDETHVYATQAFDTLVPQVSRHLGEWSGLRVLDFGAGTGLLTAKLAPKCRELFALDASPAMIARLDAKVEAEGWRNVATHAGPLSSWGGVGELDLIVASSVCSFLPDFSAELCRLSALLRTGGLFVQWDWRGGDGDGLSEGEVRSAYDAAELKAMFVGQGFIFELEDNQLEVLMGVGRKI